jgi:diadenosine tetraphosphate (Ap4A) HIT family hydrolase
MHCHCHVIPRYAGDVKKPQRFSQTRPFQLPTAALRAATLKKEAYSATLKYHDANGELYMVTFSRDRVTLSTSF